MVTVAEEDEESVAGGRWRECPRQFLCGWDREKEEQGEGQCAGRGMK